MPANRHHLGIQDVIMLPIHNIVLTDSRLEVIIFPTHRVILQLGTILRNAASSSRPTKQAPSNKKQLLRQPFRTRLLTELLLFIILHTVKSGGSHDASRRSAVA
ncbi:hypothetical protein KC19_3G168500 [Ceratodon purpureus]|uniref:Uncharacterized protein n=1 Tax=Ceratodon purpureus TaxID=3225 RepID=A0A8T0ILT0_CERPU|nr:hypothetical protein KC19_3G168500 [Ceratodon purpureus]